VVRIPFYGTRHPDLFAIERAAMDRPGLVLQALDRLLPADEPVLDIGAGDGFTAEALRSLRREVVPLEPATEMSDSGRDLMWVRGDAEGLPFRPGSFGGAYATWAYFFPSLHDIGPALGEAERVLRPGGMLAIVNNLGDDEFTALSPRDITEPTAPLKAMGFAIDIIDTCFEFESLEDSRRLLGLYFGDRGRDGARLTLSFRVGLFHKRRSD
jgi:SAM-dependent methyltransferase